MKRRRWTMLDGVLVVAAALIALAAVGVTAMADRPELTVAQQADQIAEELRCPVCKDLSAADSPAPLARQMRRQIEEQLATGVPASTIRARFVAAYGPSVLLTPPEDGWGRAAGALPLVVVGSAVLAGSVLLRRALHRTREDR